MKLYAYDPAVSIKKWIKKPEVVLDTLLDCLAENDIDAFQDVLWAYLKFCPKSALARKTKLGRRTLYDLMDPKKEFNPTLSTIGPLLNSLRTAGK